MILRCPHCATKERIANLLGPWWVKCNSCGHTMRVVGVGNHTEKDTLKKRIECPGCGYTEDCVLPDWDVTVTCPICLKKWQIEIES